MNRRGLFAVAMGALMAPAVLFFGPEPADAFERKCRVARMIKEITPGAVVHENAAADEVDVDVTAEEKVVLRGAGLVAPGGNSFKSFRALRKEWRI